MKKLVRKSYFTDVNSLFKKAFKDQVDLSWDRAEMMVPQCGFGKIALCCSDCLNGPCRLNPYAKNPVKTICGKDEVVLALEWIEKNLHKAREEKLLYFRDIFSEKSIQISAGEHGEFPAVATYDGHNLQEIIDSYLKYSSDYLNLLKDIDKLEGEYNDYQGDIKVGFGTLQKDAINIVVTGGVSKRLSRMLFEKSKEYSQKASQRGFSQGIKILALGANEFPGLDVVSTSSEQELAFVTELVDTVIYGRGLKFNSLHELARKYDTSFHQEPGMDPENWVEELLEEIVDRSRRRDISVNYSTGILKSPLEDFEIKNLISREGIKGLALIAGNTGTKVEQGSELIKTVAKLIENKYLVFTSGEASLILAKAGYFKENMANRVINLGGYKRVYKFVEYLNLLVEDNQRNQLKPIALFPEANNARNFILALSLLNSGITTYFGQVLPLWSSNDVIKQLQNNVRNDARLINYVSTNLEQLFEELDLA